MASFRHDDYQASEAALSAKQRAGIQAQGYAAARVLEFKRGLLRELLTKCTDEERANFPRIFPGGVDGIPERDLVTAIDLVKRTIDARESVQT